MYGQDGYEYLRYTKAIRIFILEGEHPGDYFWPLYYPIIGAILSLIISKTALALQLVSVLSLGISAVYLNKILTLLFPKKKYTAEYGDALLDDICDAAKEQNIIIWTIAFENTAHGANVMRQCASSPAHYFNAQGTELSDVFYSIARSINQLKLTQ